MNEYRARERWSAERPETLVVCCSDGRYHAQIEDFVRHEVSERADLLALPGGPACVDPWTSSFDEARVFEQSMRLLLTAHAVRGIWLLAHHGCAYYALRHPGETVAALRAIQIADLRRARASLVAAHPQLAVRCVFAGLEGEEVVFTTLDDKGDGGG